MVPFLSAPVGRCIEHPNTGAHLSSSLNNVHTRGAVVGGKNIQSKANPGATVDTIQWNTYNLVKLQIFQIYMFVATVSNIIFYPGFYFAMLKVKPLLKSV